MGEEIMIIAWRVWFLGATILFFNGLSQLAFVPSWKNVFWLLRSMPFIFAWPLSLFSEPGRKILMNRYENL